MPARKRDRAFAPAVVRRDGRVQAAGHPADHARLGLAGERLDALTGRPDVIGQLAAAATLKGKARRAMTPALAIRLALLMTLIPGADYAGVMAALIGDLAAVPWQRRYALPTATVASAWREAVGPGPLEELRDLLRGRHRRRAPRPRLPGRHRRRPGRPLDRRIADQGARHPGHRHPRTQGCRSGAAPASWPLAGCVVPGPAGHPPGASCVCE
jgi:hypothetical protein